MCKNKSESVAKTRKRRRVPTLFVCRWRAMRHEIEAIRRYVETVTSSFERELKSNETYFEKKSVDTTDDAIQSLAEYRGEAAVDLVDLFPAFALQTTFVATYSLLEDEMLEIARDVGRHLRINLDPEELRDKGIHAAKTHLQKLCGITVPNGREWQEAVNYGKVRNVFAHSRGRVKKDNNEFRNYVNSKKSVGIDAHDRLQLSKEFCLEVLDTVEALMDDLFKLARDRVIEATQ